MACEIGIVGGSGLYDMEELADRREVTLDTRKWKGKAVPLRIDVANAMNPSPLLVFDAWIPE